MGFYFDNLDSADLWVSEAWFLILFQVTYMTFYLLVDSCVLLFILYKI